MSLNNYLQTLLILTLAFTIIISGCTNMPSGDAEDKTDLLVDSKNFDPNVELTPKNFKSDDEFLTFVKSNSQSYDSYYSMSLMRGGISTFAADSSVMMEKSSSIAPSVDYSKTNNQVANVDEADIIKTDGEYVYTISENTLFIIKAYPGEKSKIVSTVTLDSRAEGLFIEGNNLAVFGNFYNASYFKKMNIKPRNGAAFFTLYDISDKAIPIVVKDYKFEGNYLQARMNEGFVYFITMSGLNYDSPYPTPFMLEGANIKSVSVTDIYYYPMPYNYAQLANIFSINLNNINDEVKSKSLTVEGGSNVYMSEENLFLTYTEYVNEWKIREDIVKEMVLAKLSESDLSLIKKIKNTDADILSDAEKDSKIMQIIYEFTTYMNDDERDEFETSVDKKLKDKLEAYKYFEYTIINKINVNKGEISLTANGKVPGHIMNQFSLDEKDDVLRIATTLSQRWTPVYYTKEVEVASADAKIAAQEILPRNEFTKETNNIFTLDKNLEIIDSLMGLAEGEQIFSTRFIGEKLYMVTFKQVDPFFVFDLSDPREIKELGKLKIPGFSRYLHPYDENTIIGIGRDATETGRTEGLKISLFDVSDVKNPKEVAKFVTDEKYAQSTAEYEHKAFLFSKEKNLLVIPAYNYNYYYMNSEIEQSYNGAMVFKITKDSITLKGIVDHSNSNAQYYGSIVERSLYINELLYTKSSGLLRINKIDDLTSVNKIELKDDSAKIRVV